MKKDIQILKPLKKLCERTAAFIVANPEDTGVYNPRVKEFTELVHKAGGLVVMIKPMPTVYWE